MRIVLLSLFIVRFPNRWTSASSLSSVGAGVGVESCWAMGVADAFDVEGAGEA